jgi:4-hydroxythreonine-4-phosphate dehydrogenase
MSDLAALPLALTLGKPAGIGPDLTIQLWHRRIELRLPTFYLVADPEFIKSRARVLGVDVAVRVVKPAQASDVFARALPISALIWRSRPHPASPMLPRTRGDRSIQRGVADVRGTAAIRTTWLPRTYLPIRFAEPAIELAKLAKESTGKATPQS